MDEMMESDTLLLGRKTYEGYAAAWPSRTGEFADRMNNATKYVISTTLDHPTWNNTAVIKDNVVEEIFRLKTMPGMDLMVAGSAELVNTLLENSLVDKYRLMVYPVVLGKGKRLLKNETSMQSMRLVEVKPVEDGILILIYHPREK